MRPLLLALACCTVTATPSLAQDAVQRRMQTWSAALGVECVHCHVPDRWADQSKPAFAFAQRMARMLDGLNSGPLTGIAEISCRTCHRGQPIPARLAREAWEKVLAEHQAEFGEQKNRAIAMSVYAASLGVDCTHCHEPGDRAANTKAPKAMVARMLPIFEEIPKYFDAARRPVTQCYMCHQGKLKPER